MPTKIEWAEETWNPVIGCSKVSLGCLNCYAERMALRQTYMRDSPYDGVISEETGRWNGMCAVQPSQADKPLRRKKPTLYFVCSMGDLFHPGVPIDVISLVFDVAYCCPQHRLMLLTKRPERMLAVSQSLRFGLLSNVAIGVTAENHEMASERIPILLNTPAAFRFVSIEPMLGRISLSPWLSELDLVICGCETGPGARPMDEEWARGLRRQCYAAGVPLMLKKLDKSGIRHLDGRTHDGSINWKQETHDGTQARH